MVKSVKSVAAVQVRRDGDADCSGGQTGKRVAFGHTSEGDSEDGRHFLSVLFLFKDNPGCSGKNKLEGGG